jgi:hypothetical protein
MTDPPTARLFSALSEFPNFENYEGLFSAWTLKSF